MPGGYEKFDGRGLPRLSQIIWAVIAVALGLGTLVYWLF